MPPDILTARSPQAVKPMAKAGLLTYPTFKAFPAFFGRTPVTFLKSLDRISMRTGFTAAGTVADSHGIPFSSHRNGNHLPVQISDNIIYKWKINQGLFSIIETKWVLSLVLGRVIFRLNFFDFKSLFGVSGKGMGEKRCINFRRNSTGKMFI